MEFLGFLHFYLSFPLHYPLLLHISIFTDNLNFKTATRKGEEKTMKVKILRILFNDFVNLVHFAFYY
ncbi:hypothetical protein Q3G72_020382 [Acer saccharum]|nr:hypothetical protein Q3G72_020382 [Acer saccharum]